MLVIGKTIPSISMENPIPKKLKRTIPPSIVSKPLAAALLSPCRRPPPPLRDSGSCRMNAFKAFKARVPIEWSPHLYITLVRGIPGTRRLHRRTLEALRLTKCNRTVMRWNTPTVRGMLQQVKRLVVIETEEMFNARKGQQAAHRALRPPVVVSHLPANESAS